MLQLMAGVVQDSQIEGVIGNPTVDRHAVAAFLVDLGGDRLSPEGRNFVKLLAENQRLAVLPAISRLFEEAKAQDEGTVEVAVTSAYVLKQDEADELAEMLKKMLGKQVNISSEKDPSLIGGVVIRAGDMVIDGSIKGRLQKLASDLGI
jgi:F-type H+-transporting ATPase subunit delta